MLETFVFISGYLFPARNDFAALILKKAKRLILPALIWGVVYVVALSPFNTLYDRLSSIDVYWRIANGIGHLWFLPMLFWLFIFEFIINRSKLSTNLWFLTILFVISILPYPNSYFQISRSPYYLFFFHLGYIVNLNRYKLQKFINKRNLVKILFLYIILFVIGTLWMQNLDHNLSITDNKLIRGIIWLLKRANCCIYSLFGVFTYYLVSMLIREKLQPNLHRLVGFIAFCSFGTYLLQETLLRILYYRIEISKDLGLLTPWLCGIIVLLISITGTRIMKRNKILCEIC